MSGEAKETSSCAVWRMAGLSMVIVIFDHGRVQKKDGDRGCRAPSYSYCIYRGPSSCDDGCSKFCIVDSGSIGNGTRDVCSYGGVVRG